MTTASLFEVAPTLADEAAGMRAWLFDDAHTMVSQSTTRHFTLAGARFLTQTVEAELQKRWVRHQQRVRFVHDWRTIETYDAPVYADIVQWGRVSLPHAEHVALAISPKASIFMRIAVTTGVGALRLVRMPIEVVEDLGPVLRGVGVKPTH